MTICLVTDRRRCKPPGEGLLALVREAVGAGVDLIQVREPDLTARKLAELVTAVLSIARGSPTRVVVNDRLDVALACAADGVHLRSDSVGVSDARRIAPVGFLVGRSVHTEDEARDAEGADYLIAGTVYPSSSKPGRNTWLGASGLERIVHAATAPVLAIGGVTVDRMPEVASAGAAGVAAISLFLERPVVDSVAAARRMFDTAQRAP